MTEAFSGAIDPTLEHVADVTVELGPTIAIGETGAGLRRVVPILGGRIRGPRLRGVVLGVGADYQLIRSDGFTTLDARYALRLDDGAAVYVVNTGVRFGPPELMARLAEGEPVDPASLYFRTTPRFETEAPAHLWLTRPVFIASGARYADRVEIRVFQVN